MKGNYLLNPYIRCVWYQYMCTEVSVVSLANIFSAKPIKQTKMEQRHHLLTIIGHQWWVHCNALAIQHGLDPCECFYNCSITVRF